MPENDPTDAPAGTSPAGAAETATSCAAKDAGLPGVPAASGEPSPNTATRKRHRLAALFGVAAALVLAGSITAGSITAAHSGETTQPVQAATTPAASDQPLPEVSSTAAPQALPRDTVPLRLIYPGAQADIAIDALTPTTAELTTGVVDPPQTQDAYWLTNYGSPGPGSTDTTFIISHRWIDQDAPFNRIGATAKPGDRFTVNTRNGDLDFTVNTVTTFDKATLNTAPIWAAVPGRLVMITCDLHDPWGKNTVITADPTPHQP